MIMDKEEKLRQIAREIEKCRECRRGKSGLPVPGEGNPDARVMLIGMAPGKEEARTGRPFVGRSGRLLTEMLHRIGMERKEIYITSPVKYFPEKNLTVNDIRHGAGHLKKQVDVISPGLLVLMGSVAVKALLPQERISVSKMHGRLIEKGGRRYFITFHPSAALRFPENRRMMMKDLAKLKRISGP